MSESDLNFWVFTACFIIFYFFVRWAVNKIYEYIHEMKEMTADIWWNSEKLVMEMKTKEADRLVTPDRPIDTWMEMVLDDIEELTGGI